MRILLVRTAPTTEYMKVLYQLANCESLSLEYVGAGVSGDHEVRLLDLTLENGYAGLQQTLEEFRPHIVGASAISCEASSAKQVFRQTKALDSRILTVVGGVHATMTPEDFLGSDVDIIVIGEGVFTFREIVEHFERSEDFRDIRGIALQDGGKLQRTPPRPMCHPDDLPFPDRSLTSHIRHKYHFALPAKAIALVRSTQGCPHRCDFCLLWKLTDGRYLKRSVEKLVQELKTISETHVYFIDDEFLIDAKRAMHLAQRIREEGIQKNYIVFARADTISRNPDVVRAWAEIGLKEVFIGLEAGTDDELTEMSKGTTLSDNEKALEVLRASGVTCLAALLVRADFGREDFKKLTDYARRMKLESPHFLVEVPLPGTDLYEKAKDKIVVHDYDLYDFFHPVTPTKLSLDEFYSQMHDLHNYHLEPIPLAYHMNRLAGLPEEVLNDTVSKERGLQEVILTMVDDHHSSVKTS